MKRILQTVLAIVLIFLSIRVTNAQTVIYLPVILSENERETMDYPILSISNGIDTINFLDPGSGIKLANPYWTPNIAQLKDGGVFVNPSNADGQALVAANYDNVVETIPLLITGPEGSKTIERARKLFQMSVNAQNYYTTSFEQNQVYFAVKPKSDKFVTAYATVYTLSIGELGNPFGAPFVNDIDVSAIENVNLIIQREPFFSPVKPGEVIGPYFNQILNSDFYNWSNGLADIEPDQWSILVGDLATGTVNASTNTHFNNGYSLEIDVTTSSGAADRYGIYQTLDFLNTSTPQTYTFVAWIKNNSITNGEAQIRLTDGSGNYQYLYQTSISHLFDVYYTVFDGSNLADGNILEVLIQANAANTVGTFLVDSMMILNGDYSQEIEDNLIYWLSSSQVLNSYDSNRENVTYEDRIPYVDIWNVPGDVLAPMSLVFQNITSPNDVGGNTDSKLKNVIIGEKYKLDKSNFADIYDVGGSTTINGNENNLFTTLALNDEWSIIGSWAVNDRTTAIANASNYKMFARIRDGSTSDLEIRLKYWVSDPTKFIYMPSYLVTTKGRFINVDLTHNEMVNFANAVKNINVSSFGYFIEARRPNGETTSFEIDYVRHIALDNYFNTHLSLPLTTYNSLNIKQNDVTPYITTYTVLNQWTLNGYLTPYVTRFNRLVIYNNELFMKFSGFSSFSTGIVKFNNQELSLAYNPNDVNVSNSFTIGDQFQGLIPYYEFDISTFPNSAKLYLTNGKDWPGTFITTLGSGLAYLINHMHTFNNQLFLLGDSNSSGTVYMWDGNSLHDLGNPGGTDAYQAIVYKNNLYVATASLNSENYIHRWDGGTNWTEIYSYVAAADTIQPPYMTIHNNKLYFTDNVYTLPFGGNPGKSTFLYSYDGNNLELVYDSWLDSTTGYLVPETLLASYNGSLYVLGDRNIASSIHIWKSADNGETFNQVHIWPSSSGSLGLTVFQGSLYVLTKTALYSYTEISDNAVYSQSDFEGNNKFLANNRKITNYEYQRLLFKFTRELNEDYLEDSAMISVGIRPQYFSLINKDDY